MHDEGELDDDKDNDEYEDETATIKNEYNGR